MLADMQLSKFIEELSSDAPAPGGGSASALCGAIGAGLVSMVCRLTMGKKGYEAVQQTVAVILSESEALNKVLLSLVDRDTEAFNAIMASFKQPITTEEEKESRRSAIQTAFKGAVEIPREVASHCLSVLSLAENLKDKGNRNAASDLGVAVEAAFAGMRGALMNIEINLPTIKDDIYVKQMQEEVRRFKERGEALKREVLETTQKIIGS